MIKLFVTIPLEELRSMIGVKYNPKGKEQNPCLICGKELKVGATYKQVHLLTTGEICSYSGDDIDTSQGFHNVGNDCAKKLVLKFAF